MVLDNDQEGPYRIRENRIADELDEFIKKHGMKDDTSYKIYNDGGKTVVQLKRELAFGKYGMEFEYKESSDFDISDVQGVELEELRQGQKFPRKEIT